MTVSNQIKSNHNNISVPCAKYCCEVKFGLQSPFIHRVRISNKWLIDLLNSMVTTENTTNR